MLYNALRQEGVIVIEHADGIAGLTMGFMRDPIWSDTGLISGWRKLVLRIERRWLKYVVGATTSM